MLSSTASPKLTGGNVNCACPRCGYDQSGIVASWRDSCPLEGKCSECGLELAWANVLNPQLSWPRWSFEHAQRRLARSYLRTLFETLRPWKLFAGIRMEHPIHFGRLAILLVICLVAMHLGLAAMCASGWYQLYWAWFYQGHSGFITLRDVGMSALWPYSDEEFLWYFHRNPVSPGIRLGAPMAVFMPAAFLLLPITFRRMKVRVAHIVRVGICGLVAPFLFWSMLLVVWAAYESFDAHNFLTHQNYRPRPPVESVVRIGSVLTILWTPYFWWRAGKQYLKLPRSLFVVIMLTIVTGLLTIVLWAYIPWLIRQIG